ncbi:MAG: hypothetical protein HZR80_19430 [Candidatus Heimdallarchaeota archaeon]
MLSAVQILFLMISSITFVSLSFLVIMLFRKYLEKKTIGTLLLLFAYFDSLMADVLIDISVWLQIFIQTETVEFASTILMHLSTIFLIHVIAFMYFFGNRVALLKDSDITKVIYTTLFLGLWGAYAALGLQEIIQKVASPVFYIKFPVEGTSVFFIFPTINRWLSIIPILFMLIGVLTYFRIFFRCLSLARKARNRTEQRMNTYNYLSVIFYMFTGVTLALYYVSTNIYIMTTVFAMRGISIILASIYGYLGWIQPEFIKKVLRDKTHIALYFEGKVERPKTPPTFFSTPESREKEQSNPQHFDKIVPPTETPTATSFQPQEVMPEE